MKELLWNHGGLWPLLLLVPLVAGLVWFAHARVSRNARRYGARGAERPARRWPRVVITSLMTLCLAIAALEPLFGKQQVAVERRGLDLLFCLDCSRSMLARDVEPDRLTRAKYDVQSLLPLLVGGDRIALIAFAGQARLVVPLTHDVDSFRHLLGTVDTDTVRTGGTDLAAALRKALEAAETGHERTSVIVLLTDGEDLGGTGKQAASEAAARGLVVHAIGYGSTQGSKIVLKDPQKTSESFLKSGQGEEVISTLDADGLRALCAAAGGDFLRADVVPEPLIELKAKRLDPIQKRSYDAGKEVLHQTRFQWALWPAWVLLLIQIWSRGGSRK